MDFLSVLFMLLGFVNGIDDHKYHDHHFTVQSRFIKHQVKVSAPLKKFELQTMKSFILF